MARAREVDGSISPAENKEYKKMSLLSTLYPRIFRI